MYEFVVFHAHTSHINTHTNMYLLHTICLHLHTYRGQMQTRFGYLCGGKVKKIRVRFVHL